MASVDPSLSTPLTLPVRDQSGSLSYTVVPRYGPELVQVLGTNLYSLLSSVTFSRLSIVQSQINSYLASALITQNNINNLTIALTDISSGNDPYGNNSAITVTWDANGSFTTSTSTIVQAVKDYVASAPFSLTLQTKGESSLVQQNNAQQISQAIANQQNSLSTEQTFLNSAVTALQSNVSLAGQIVQALNSLISTIESLTR